MVSSVSQQRDLRDLRDLNDMKSFHRSRKVDQPFKKKNLSIISSVSQLSSNPRNRSMTEVSDLSEPSPRSMKLMKVTSNERNHFQQHHILSEDIKHINLPAQMPQTEQSGQSLQMDQKLYSTEQIRIENKDELEVKTQHTQISPLEHAAYDSDCSDSDCGEGEWETLAERELTLAGGKL